MQLKTRVLIVAQPANRYIVAFHIAILYDILLTYQAVAVKGCRRASIYRTWIQDLLIQDQDQDQDSGFQDQDSEVQDQNQDQDSTVSRPRPRPRLWCPRSRPRLKTYKTNTGSPWLGWTVTNKKTEVMASRKPSISVVTHSKQQNIILCLTTVLFRQLPLIIAVYQTLARTHIWKVPRFIDN